MKYKYYIDLDERGEFDADVRNEAEDTVFTIKGFEIFEDDYMKHSKDIDGLKDHLVSLGIMKPGDNLISGN